MCLIVFAYKVHPDYPLILATNRDEFYARPSREADFWTNENLPYLLAGKDMKAGGTWMGLHKDGRWGAVTNYRDPSIQKTNPPSRGELVLQYLRQQEYAMEFLQQVTKKAEDYSGFNMLLWDETDFVHYSNQSKVVNRIKPGIHGLSNALLNTGWPKVQLAKNELDSIIQKKEIPRERLFELLLNEQKAPDDKLPVTGIPRHLEKAVSSVFIQTEQYGTRSSSVLLVDNNGQIDFTERAFKPGTKEVETEKRFQLEPK